MGVSITLNESVGMAVILEMTSQITLLKEEIRRLEDKLDEQEKKA